MFLSRRGLGTVEILASLAIFGIIALTSSKIISVTRQEVKDSKEALLQSIKEVDSIIAHTAFLRIAAQIRKFSLSELCQYEFEERLQWTWNPGRMDISKEDPVVPPGLEFQLVDFENRRVAGIVKDKNREMGNAIERCFKEPTLYEAFGRPARDQKKQDSFRFCAVVRRHRCNIRNDSWPNLLSAFDKSSPLLIEFNFIVVDSTGKRLSCGELSQLENTFSGKLMGVLQYQYHWDPAAYSFKARKDIFLKFGGMYQDFIF